jgi:hypothetical protein
MIGIKHGSEMAKGKFEIGVTVPTNSYRGRFFFVEQPKFLETQERFPVFYPA